MKKNFFKNNSIIGESVFFRNKTICDPHMSGDKVLLDELLEEYKVMLDSKTSQDVADLLQIRKIQYLRSNSHAEVLSKKYNSIISCVWSAFAGVTAMFGLNAIVEGLTANSTIVFGSLAISLLAGGFYLNEKKIQVLDGDYDKELDMLVLSILAENKEWQEHNPQASLERALRLAIQNNSSGQNLREQVCAALNEYDRATGQAERNNIENKTSNSEQAITDNNEEIKLIQFGCNNCGGDCDKCSDCRKNDESCESEQKSTKSNCSECHKCDKDVKIIREQDFLIEGVTRPNSFVVTARARKDMEEFLFGENTNDAMQR